MAPENARAGMVRWSVWLLVGALVGSTLSIVALGVRAGSMRVSPELEQRAVSPELEQRADRKPKSSSTWLEKVFRDVDPPTPKYGTKEFWDLLAKKKTVRDPKRCWGGACSPEHGFRVNGQQPKPDLVPLPSRRVWSVPAPTMMPGRLQQILKGVKALDIELRKFNIKTGHWQELITKSIKNAKRTVKDLQRQSKRMDQVKDKVKSYLNSPGPPGAPGPMGLQGPMGPDGGMGDVGGRGPKGEQGDAGVMGSAGPIGMEGRTGNPGKPGRVGKPGRAGIAGSIGYQGEPGELGARGKHGKPGDKGLVGPAGMDVVGIAGNQGIPGPPGEMGRPGPPGPEGSEGLQGNIGIRGKWGLPGTQGIFGEVQGQIWDPLTWNEKGPESPRTVGRRDGGGGWNEYAGTPAYNARRRAPRQSLHAYNHGTTRATSDESSSSDDGRAWESTESLYPEHAPRVLHLKAASAAPRLSDEQWWEKEKARKNAAKRAGPKRVGCEGSTSVEDLTNDSLYVACNSMGKGAEIQLNGFASTLKKVETAPEIDGQNNDYTPTITSANSRSREVKNVKKAMKTFESITLRDDDNFAIPPITDLDHNGNPVDDAYSSRMLVAEAAAAHSAGEQDTTARSRQLAAEAAAADNADDQDNAAAKGLHSTAANGNAKRGAEAAEAEAADRADAEDNAAATVSGLIH